MELSSAYYMYKNNPQYRRAKAPRVIYLKGSEANIQDSKQISQIEFTITARDSLVIGFQKDAGDEIVYTTNGTEPSKYLTTDKMPEVIHIVKDGSLKAKAFRPGLIDSTIVTFHFKLIDPTTAKPEAQGLETLQRPEDTKGDLSEDFSGYEDLFGGDDAYGSIHLQGAYSTPGN